MLKLLEKYNDGFGLYECVCGIKRRIRISSVNYGTTKSCGCLRKQQAKINGKKVTSHGQYKEPQYKLWLRLKQECTPGKKKYNGSTMCSLWYNSYTEFNKWLQSKSWSTELSLSRIDHNISFSPDNCILIPKLEAKIKARKYTCTKKYGTESHLTYQPIKDKIKQKNIDIYGVSNPAKSEIIKNKTKINNIKKYGVEYPQQLEEKRIQYRKISIDNNQAIVHENKTIAQWAKELGFNRSWFGILVKKYGFDYAKNYIKSESLPETKIKEYLLSHNIKFIQQFKVENRYADFYLPDNNIIIEVDGIYWHSDAINTDKYYHLKKKELYNKYNYQSIFFRENEILNKFDIVTSIINNKLNLCQRIYARKCKIELVSGSFVKEWLDANHLMGHGSGKAYVLKFNNEIVACMQIIEHKNYIEIDRFCTQLNTTIIGGFSKLLNCLLKYNKNITTFIDKRYGNGSYLSNFGFKLVTLYPSFVWVKNNKVVHRMTYPSNSGYVNGYNKLWDCGQAKYVK